LSAAVSTPRAGPSGPTRRGAGRLQQEPRRPAPCETSYTEPGVSVGHLIGRFAKPLVCKAAANPGPCGIRGWRRLAPAAPPARLTRHHGQRSVDAGNAGACRRDWRRLAVDGGPAVFAGTPPPPSRHQRRFATLTPPPLAGLGEGPQLQALPPIALPAVPSPDKAHEFPLPWPAPVVGALSDDFYLRQAVPPREPAAGAVALSLGVRTLGTKGDSCLLALACFGRCPGRPAVDARGRRVSGHSGP